MSARVRLPTKPLRELAQFAEPLGIEWDRLSSGHVVFRSPGGQQIHMPQRPNMHIARRQLARLAGQRQ